MTRNPLAVTGAAVAAVAVGGGALTYAMSGTQSTTGLDRFTSVTVDGHKALKGDIVAGRTESKYSPLPWIGGETSGLECPDLKAVAGTRVTCTAKDGDGKDLAIPVTVVKADASSVTWKFERK
ncbi:MULTISPECIES: hypothetical protein [Streptomyces]|uniref:DUF4333 domain-containing protein n=1 Tax=Streptomyces stelliscabiei TaxID=146820 RepID=A0A8I0TVR1_9ACTN|nr:MULTISPECIES: hypothetical protein [Streptomyces]KND42578.1 hypothetical protein IQ64_22975 [Streptomyces stelliscabiei]MBE1602167.1 hypothetical protein [Streptomyces stelliscabiei]MDX2514376.1 hypothetical protein [Streptomyces stelliscabiei]MDX2552359.1 hypothetical protein [Streptomyces stelliscabiei]MDX2611754.1 hypothetical protein [Streptomyces stelliscabiei]